jgi:hypothetical protein
LRRHIPNFAEIIKMITDMLKKNNEVKWIVEDKASFECVKKDIWEALVLEILDYTKEFLVFSFSYEHTIATMLL